MHLNDVRVSLDDGSLTPENAIRAAGQLLVDDGLAEPRYSEAMIGAFRDLGPYIVLVPGIAMPHARPEAGAIRDGLAVLRLAQPVEFGHPENDPVRLVIPLVGSDNHSHIDLLKRLSRVLMDPEAVNTLLTTDDTAAVTALFNGLKN
ncbi:phosphoenolpyruvate-dependent sugar phosphotransferase system EIIA 2 [Microbacterium laevaniformans OR221]|nr:phosphoenolpyruvate-dependent sugar phosphotransferase system EIIA 2 [Microbacterium laevaniformans OR221]